MAQPGSFANANRGEDWIGRELAQLRREMNELRAANPFASMGLKPMPDGLIVQGYETVNGPLTVNGNSAINGTMSINGPLILQPGSIQNDALTNPVSFGQLSVTATNFAIGTTAAIVATGTVPVPPGYTQANVSVSVAVGAVNPTASADFLYAQAGAGAVGSLEMFAYAGPSGGVAWVGSAKTTTITGLSGGGIVISAYAHSQNGAWAANATNRAFVEASVTFLR